MPFVFAALNPVQTCTSIHDCVLLYGRVKEEEWTCGYVYAHRRKGWEEVVESLGILTAENQGVRQLAVKDVQEDSARHVRHSFGRQDDCRQHVKEAVLHKTLKYSVLLNHNNVPGVARRVPWFQHSKTSLR